MLILTRKSKQSICIADNIEILVVGVRGNRVQLEIRAPSDLVIRRKEVGDRPPNSPLSGPVDREPLEVG